MALLGTIRNKFGWLMMGLIFVGLGSFLLMDASGPQNQMGGNSTKAGSINGEKITRDEIRTYSQNLQGRGMLQEEIDQRVWDQIIAEKLLNQKATEAGFKVTADEMGELFLSQDRNIISSLVANQFGDRTTGQINFDQIRQALTTFKNRGSIVNQYKGEQQTQMLEQYDAWKDLEKSVQVDRLRNKYFSALDLGFYTPDWMVQMENGIRNSSYNFDYVSVPYPAVSGEGDVTEEEIKAYISANPRQYKREASVSLDYVLFDVIPTSDDSAAYQTDMSKLAEEFKSTSDDSLFISSNDGTFAAEYLTADEITEPSFVKDSLLNAPNGTVVGPYLHNGQYRVTKAFDHKIMPDSVKARHILFPAKTQEEGQAGFALLDSLKKVLEDDPTASFDSLAMQFSKDGSASKGGDLGWKAKDGSFVPQFEEHMFYTGEKDELKIIYTQFGVHLIQITDYKYINDKKAVRLAVISQDIIPSDKTLKTIKHKVNDFIVANTTAEKMKEAAKAAGLQMGSAASLEIGAYEIAGVGKNSAAAELISWGHNEETNEGDVSSSLLGIDNQKLDYTEKFVVAAVTNKTPKGLASAKDPVIKAEVDRILRNEKKAAIVSTKLKEVKTLEALASAYSTASKTASSINYDLATLNSAGKEPKVLGLAANTSAGKVSSTAVAGNEGIYVVRTIGKVEAPAISDMNTTRNDLNSKISSAISGSIFNDMKENSTIVDKRKEY